MKGNPSTKLGVKKRLVILDTHAILHRAYHALPDFSSSKGEPTGALYGLISMLVKIITDLKPDYIAAALDLPGPTHRHVSFKAYKAQRPKTEDDLIAQIKRSRDVLEALGIPMYSSGGYEADDVIGTIVEKLKKQNETEIIIASGDMDALQLVDDKRVQVYTLKKGLSETILYDEAAVEKRFGFGPKLLPDYKGLRGDPSDNIPGVKGIGEKTAGILISNFGRVEEIYTKLKKNPAALEEAGVKGATLEKLKAGEENALFSKALAEISTNVPIDFSIPKKSWREGVDTEKLLNMLSEFEFRSLIPRVKELLSAETPSQSPRVASLNQTFAHEPPPPDKEDLQKILLAVWVLDSSITKPTIEDAHWVGKSKDFDEARKHILSEIKKQNLSFVYEGIELPLMPILRAMEKRGVLIDRKFLTTLSLKYHKELDKLAVRIYKVAEGEFNINSPRQLGEVLFDKLKITLKNHKKTAGGQRSTRESELEKMKGLHPVIADILAYRELQKLLSTYIDSIPTLVDDNSRLHTSFVQTGTTTGRISSQDPNLQNIPIKTDLGRAIRDAFVADAGLKLVSFDYSQIELRIAAMLSGDKGLIDIFKNGRDVHTEVAARIFGVKTASYDQRRAAKVINFGILYGMGVNSLREALGTSRAEAQEFYNQYFKTFPRLAEYIEEVKADAARRGYTETLFGRRRYFEGIKSPIPYVRAAAERMAINAPMQGTQSDIVKLAMIKIDELFKKEGVSEKAHLLLQVHDELVFEIADKEIEKLSPKIKEIMENVLPKKDTHGVPIIAEGKMGRNWGEMEKI